MGGPPGRVFGSAHAILSRNQFRSEILGPIGFTLFLLVGLHKARAAEPARIAFEERAQQAGIRFQFDTGTRGRHDLPEIMGGGVALIHVDGDGWIDIYLCNGGPIVSRAGRDDAPCRLYRNNRDGTFVDITGKAAAPGPSYAMGAAVGDYDGDGRDDLFVTGWRDQRLYRNRGNGTLEDVTERAGVVSHAWSTSAAFADLDGDGDLDLYVANYLDYDPVQAPFCAAPDGKRDYCGPEEFPAQADKLYRNNGDGTFADVSHASGVDLPEGRGLGVLVAELTGDDRLDIYVANDGTACWLFQNVGGLQFREVGLAAGVALDAQGNALAAMGVAHGDLNGDGRPDLAVSNYYGRSTVVFESLGEGKYRDVSAQLGVTAATRNVLGFGLALADFDNDGLLDLLQANGHVLDRERLGVPFAMRPLVLRNEGVRLRDVSKSAGGFFERKMLGRGLAIGDLDHDGRLDAVINALDAPAAILWNVSEAGNSLTLELLGSERSAIGAHVVARVGEKTLVRELVAGGSYLSASSRALQIGLDRAEKVDLLEVRWPSGKVEEWRSLSTGPKARQLKEGEGVRIPSTSEKGCR